MNARFGKEFVTKKYSYLFPKKNEEEKENKLNEEENEKEKENKLKQDLKSFIETFNENKLLEKIDKILDYKNNYLNKPNLNDIIENFTKEKDNIYINYINPFKKSVEVCRNYENIYQEYSNDIKGIDKKIDDIEKKLKQYIINLIRLLSNARETKNTLNTSSNPMNNISTDTFSKLIKYSISEEYYSKLDYSINHHSEYNFLNNILKLFIAKNAKIDDPFKELIAYLDKEENINFNDEKIIDSNYEEIIDSNDEEIIDYNDEEIIDYNDEEIIDVNNEEIIDFNNGEIIDFNDEENIISNVNKFYNMLLNTLDPKSKLTKLNVDTERNKNNINIDVDEYIKNFLEQKSKIKKHIENYQNFISKQKKYSEYFKNLINDINENIKSVNEILCDIAINIISIMTNNISKTPST